MLCIFLENNSFVRYYVINNQKSLLSDNLKLRYSVLFKFPEVIFKEFFWIVPFIKFLDFGLVPHFDPIFMSKMTFFPPLVTNS